MSDAHTYYHCPDCGEATTGNSAQPCKCMREWREAREDERLAKESRDG